MDDYKIKLELETSDEYKQARKDIIKAFESYSKITEPELRRKLAFEICSNEIVKRALNTTDEQMNAFLRSNGF